MDPKGKVALISGGARIGKAVALALAARGCHLVLTYRSSRAAAEETASEAVARGVQTLTVRMDVGREEEIRAALQAVERQWGGLDILINLSSVYQKVPFDRLDLETWRASQSVDLQGSYLLALNAVPLMRRKGSGRMVFFSDWIAASGRPRYREYLPYYVWKRGILGLTEGLALELAPEILVNAIAPGPILAPPEMRPKEQEEVERGTPLKRWGGEGEIAKAALFLVETDFITGECIRVDGGRHLY